MSKAPSKQIESWLRLLQRIILKLSILTADRTFLFLFFLAKGNFGESCPKMPQFLAFCFCVCLVFFISKAVASGDDACDTGDTDVLLQTRATEAWEKWRPSCVCLFFFTWNLKQLFINGSFTWMIPTIQNWLFGIPGNSCCEKIHVLRK